jgi:hypothetical protein
MNAFDVPGCTRVDLVWIVRVRWRLIGLLRRINESPDPFERLLALLRFLFSKDIKFIVRVIHALAASPTKEYPSTAKSANPTTPSWENSSWHIGM